MRGALPLVLTVVGVAGCNDQTPASAYRSWTDRVVVAAGLSDAFWPCYVKQRGGHSDSYASIPTDQCFKMDPPKRWQGLYFSEFEGSRFCPAPATECSLETPGEKISLSFARGSTLPQSNLIQPGISVDAIDFIGRRTAVKGRYEGQFDYELIVDRVISIKQLVFSPEPTEAQYEVELKRRGSIKK